jgi:hypothetical protein
MQMFGGDSLIEAVLGVYCFELDDFCPFFSRLLFVSQSFQGFGVFGVMDDSSGVQLDGFLKVDYGGLSGCRRELAVDKLGDPF